MDRSEEERLVLRHRYAEGKSRSLAPLGMTLWLMRRGEMTRLANWWSGGGEEEVPGEVDQGVDDGGGED
jgi:hypothetical protein